MAKGKHAPTKGAVRDKVKNKIKIQTFSLQHVENAK